MSIVQRLISIAIAALANFATRVTPFLLFDRSAGEKKQLNPFIEGLGKFLPPAIMGMLVVYCYRNVNLISGNHGLPDLLAGIVTILIHLWRRNMFLSLITGTVVYILLIDFVF